MLPINITDELGHDILRYTAFIATIGSQNPQPVAMVDPGFYVVADGVLLINVNGTANQSVILTLDGNLMGHWHSDLQVQLFQCPPGLSQIFITCQPKYLYMYIVLRKQPLTYISHNLIPSNA